ncbi:MAG: hypothetical protein PSV22_04425 [Pseudolabrys sp.]|nr:hypothetical protein [Pseudolabrys sp.]
MVLISGPAIARLNLRTRKWAFQAIRRGDFGPVSTHRGVLFVTLDAVQSRIGMTFSDAQIESAAEGIADRIIRTQPQEETNGAIA